MGLRAYPCFCWGQTLQLKSVSDLGLVPHAAWDWTNMWDWLSSHHSFMGFMFISEAREIPVWVPCLWLDPEQVWSAWVTENTFSESSPLNQSFYYFLTATSWKSKLLPVKSYVKIYQQVLKAPQHFGFLSLLHCNFASGASRIFFPNQWRNGSY